MDLVWPLGLAGVRCAVVAAPSSPALHSRHVDGLIPWTDFWAGPEDLVAALLRFAAAQPRPPTLFYEEDSQLLLVSRHRDRLARAFRFVIADPELVEDLVDKGRFLDLAERCGLPVPRSRRIRPGAGAPPPDAGLRFPLIVKPLTRGHGWNDIAEGGKALRVETPAAIGALWPRLAATGAELLLQELVPGPESRVESYHVYMDAGGRVAGAFTGRKIRTWPVELGHSTALEISDAPDVARLGQEVVERIGLRGVAKLDFKRAPDGTLHLLEINPRFNLWHHLGAAAGVNLPALVHADLTGQPRPAVAPARAGARWCRPKEDRLAARASGIGTAAWARWMLGCDVNSAFRRDDPMPFLRGQVAARALRRLRGRAGRDGGGMQPAKAGN